MADRLALGLIVAGSAVAGSGLGLLDWRLAVVWFGLLCMAAGAARLRANGEGG